MSPAPLVEFQPFNASDGSLWIAADDVRRVTKAPNRRTAARVFYYADGREEWFDTSESPSEVAAIINAARAHEDAPRRLGA